MTEDSRALSLIAGVREATNALRTYTPVPDEYADVSGLVREIEVQLGDYRRGVEEAAKELREIEEPASRVRIKEPFHGKDKKPVAQGQMYELVPDGYWERSYNTPGILTKLAEFWDLDLARTLSKAMRDRAEGERLLELKWRWTPLKKLNDADNGFTLDTVKGEEVEDDLDGPDVGAIWKSKGMKRVPIVRSD